MNNCEIISDSLEITALICNDIECECEAKLKADRVADKKLCEKAMHDGLLAVVCKSAGMTVQEQTDYILESEWRKKYISEPV